MSSILTRLYSSARVVYTHRSGRRIKEKMAKAMEKKKAGEQKHFTLKVPKGTQDYGAKEMVIREGVFNHIIEVFKRHGAVTIDTPVFEMRDLMLGKYGEEGGKLIYDLADQGGELYSLRYDLTVPFARYVAMNKIDKIKRYHIAKVYRRDNPVMTKGRYREFYQCDFDIAGSYETMSPEAECLRITDEILTKLDIGEFEIKLNHRCILNGMLELCGIEEKDYKTVSSSIDKLDKAPWGDVQNELINEKKINEEAVKKLEGFVRFRENNPNFNNSELLDKMLEYQSAKTNKNYAKGIEELKILLTYLDLFAVKGIKIEPSLARGLDYYTGAIYEVVIKDFSFSGLQSGNKEQEVSVGSVAAGGRYDNLVFDLAGGKGKSNVPCVGISFGIERLFSIMRAKMNIESIPIRTVSTDVFVTAPQKGMLKNKMKVIQSLWNANINADMVYKENAKMLNDVQFCEKELIPFMIVVGQKELEEGKVKIRNVKTREETDVLLCDLEKELLDRISTLKTI